MVIARPAFGENQTVVVLLASNRNVRVLHDEHLDIAKIHVVTLSDICVLP